VLADAQALGYAESRPCQPMCEGAMRPGQKSPSLASLAYGECWWIAPPSLPMGISGALEIRDVRFTPQLGLLR